LLANIGEKWMAIGTVLTRILSFALPVGIAAAIFVFAVQRSEPPSQTPLAEREKTVRVMEVRPVEFVPSVTGYGSVEPEKSWDAVAQVSGRIIYLHPNLRSGAILPKDTVIIRINPEDYEIALRQSQASLEGSRAKLAELQIQQASAQDSLAIEKRSLELTRKDIERKRDLVQRNTVSALTVEEAERVLLTQQARVQDLENSIRRYPSQIDAQREQINADEAALETARLNLERTVISLPFDGRIATASVEETQFVSAGASLATADAISGAEVKAEISQASFRAFASLTAPPDFSPPQLSDNALAEAIEKIGWTAEVRLNSDDRPAKWPARVVRTSDTINPQTRTVGVIVYVERPYADIRPETKPPLVKGMFVEVEIRGRPIRDAIVIPRAAIRNGKVYIADEDNRLRIREVTVQVEQGGKALISGGIAPGDRLVLSEFSPAIEGMLLDPVIDNGDSGGDTNAAMLRTNPAERAAR
jgi:RND family efflux transporter MFP subunit